MSTTRHVLHVAPEPESGEWKAWCCCGWASYTWRLEESARTAAETHVAFVNSSAAARWRQYTFFPSPGTTFNPDCLELISPLDAREDGRAPRSASERGHVSERRRRRRYELDCGDGIVVQTTLRGPLDTKTADALRELGRAAVKHVEDPRCSACGHARSQTNRERRPRRRAMREPTLRQRANAAIREAAQVRRGDWKGDESFKRFGETLLDRYEALARQAKAHTEPDREQFYG